MEYTDAQLSFLVERGMRPDADDETAESFARSLTDPELADFERIGAEDTGNEPGSNSNADDTTGGTGGDNVNRSGTQTPTEDTTGGTGTAGTGTGGDDVNRKDPDPDIDEIVNRRLAAAESQRIARLNHISTQAGNDVPRELVERAMREVWPEDRVDREFLQAIRRRAPSVGNEGHVGIHTGRAATVQALQAGLLLRHGVDLQNPIFAGREASAMLARSHANARWLHQANAQIARGATLNPEFERAMDAGHQYADVSLVDICRSALEISGRQVPHDRGEMIQRALSTASLQHIFSTSVNMVLLDAYLGYEDTTRGWTFEQEVGNFLQQDRSRLEKAGGLAKLPRGKQEADHITYEDNKESYVIERYAGQFIVDERDIIDDQFGGMAQHTPRELGEMAAEKRPELVYGILTGNPDMRDGTALFHTNHGNAATSAPLDAATLEAARAAMARQTENGRSIQTMMRTLIVPESLRFTAERLVNSAELRDTTSDTLYGVSNPNQGRFGIVSDPRLDNGIAGNAGSLTTWYGAARAGRHTIEVGYLRGAGRAPRIETFMLTGGQWGMGWKCNIDIGAKAIDWRGLYRAVAT